MKNNFYYIIIIIIGLVITLFALISTFVTDNPEAENWLYRGLKIVEIAGFFMLVMNGTFIKTKYFRILKGIIAIILIGALVQNTTLGISWHKWQPYIDYCFFRDYDNILF